MAIEAKNTNNEKLLGEAADLVYHLLVPLESRSVSLGHVVNMLKRRAPRGA